MFDDEDSRFDFDFCMFDEFKVKSSILPRREWVQDENMSDSIKYKINQIYCDIDNISSQKFENDIFKRFMRNETLVNVKYKSHNRSNQMSISTKLSTEKKTKSHTRKINLKSIK